MLRLEGFAEIEKSAVLPPPVPPDPPLPPFPLLISVPPQPQIAITESETASQSSRTCRGINIGLVAPTVASWMQAVEITLVGAEVVLPARLFRGRARENTIT